MNHLVSRFDFINLPRALCLRLLGREHRPHHRIMAGSVIMIGGVLIAQGGHICEIWLIKIGCELVGYSFHGLGIVPILEWLMDEGDPPTPSASAPVLESAHLPA